jgi:hypothetical protein
MRMCACDVVLLVVVFGRRHAMMCVQSGWDAVDGVMPSVSQPEGC